MVILLDNHPNDSRITIRTDGVVQTLSSRMGTGGATCLSYSKVFRKVHRAKSKTDFETWEETETANTINLFDLGDVRSTTIILTKHEDV